jgi:hypothetical protein
MKSAGACAIALASAIMLTVGFAAGVAFARLGDSYSALAVPDPRPGLDLMSPAPPPPDPQPVVVEAPHPVAVRARPAPKIKGVNCGPKGARVMRFRVAVDRGLRVSRDAFIAGVRRVLCDRRSWIASGRVRFVYDARGPYVITLRTREATEQRCRFLTGLSVNEHYSCASAWAREAVLNADRWLYGSPTWPGAVEQYRALLVNHEIGHVLGQGHRGCSGAGPAPVMMQQSKGMGGCRANEWPLAYEIRSIRF